MKTNPQTKLILCFGDSNTWGKSPETLTRFPVDVRWTGQLQQKLGDAYEVIEEGLSSRTTNVDYAAKFGLNGYNYFVPCLQSHSSLDYVVVMLGTNDFKTEFQRTAADVCRALAEYIAITVSLTSEATGLPAKIILVSPLPLTASASKFHELYDLAFGEQSIIESEALAAQLEQLAWSSGLDFIAAADYATTGEDGIHWALSSHAKFADALADKISLAA